jgi:hypothetical protein
MAKSNKKVVVDSVPTTNEQNVPTTFGDISTEAANEPKQKGRKVNPNSNRQKYLAEMAAKKADPNYVPKKGRPIVPGSKHAIAMAEREAAIAAGTFVPGKRGRHIDGTSARQQKINAINMAKEQGTYRLGRPVSETSKRQQKLAKMEANKIANGGVIKLGRPKVVKQTEAPVNGNL